MVREKNLSTYRNINLPIHLTALFTNNTITLYIICLYELFRISKYWFGLCEIVGKVIVIRNQVQNERDIVRDERKT